MTVCAPIATKPSAASARTSSRVIARPLSVPSRQSERTDRISIMIDRRSSSSRPRMACHIVVKAVSLAVNAAADLAAVFALDDIGSPVNMHGLPTNR